MEKRIPREIEALDEDVMPDEFDTFTANVEAIDGVVVDSDEELVKMLFFHFKPEVELLDDERIRCKCVLEGRISKSRFVEMADDLHRKAMALRGNETGINPMFG